MRDIKININTGTLKWTEDFIKCDGKHLLLETLAFSNYFGSGDENKKKRDLQTETLLTIRGLANTSFGITEFKKDKEFLKFLVLFLDHPDRNAKDTVLFLLAQFCTLDEENFNGFELVLEAFNFYKIVKQEKHRFETFVRVLKDSKHPENKFNACCLLNGLITGSENETHRIKIQKEFMNLGLETQFKEFIKNEVENKDIFEEVNNISYDNIKIQMEFFLGELEESMEDLKELDLNELKDPLTIVQVLNDKLEGLDAYDNLMSILTQLVLYSRFSDNEEKKRFAIRRMGVIRKNNNKINKKRMMEILQNSQKKNYY